MMASAGTEELTLEKGNKNLMKSGQNATNSYVK